MERRKEKEYYRPTYRGKLQWNPCTTYENEREEKHRDDHF
jgi:hypothetical protein